MTGDALQPLDSFIIGRLNGDATLATLLGGSGKIWQGLLPESLVLPGVTFDLVSATLNNVVGSGSAGRIFLRPVYLIKAITQANSYAQSAAIASRIDQVLVGVPGTVPAANLNIGGLFQVEPIRYFEVVNGVRLNHQGARYATFLSAIS